MMKLDKNTFLKSELGQGWVACITEWDMALGRRSKTQWGTLEYLEECKIATTAAHSMRFTSWRLSSSTA